MQTEDQLVVVRVDDGYYGLSVASIKEIVKPKPVTPIPHTATFVKGLMNLRGQIVTVINLAGKLATLEIKAKTLSNSNKALQRIVVISHEGELIGLYVDGVEKVVTIGEHDLELPEESGLKNLRIIDGILKSNDKLVMKINTELLLQPISSEGGDHE